MPCGENRWAASDSVYAVPLFDQWLLHAPLHSVTALCSEALLIGLQRSLLAVSDGRPGALLEALRRAPAPAPATRTGPIHPDFMGIIPTRGCNFACRYCAFGAAEDDLTIMDSAMALGAVEWLADNVRARGGDSLSVDFFGGEPMVAPELVESVVRRTRALAAEYGLRPALELATNGCFDEARCRFVGENIDNVILSFDGPPDVQNFHRPLRSGASSFDIVAGNATLLAASRCNLSIRICVTEATVERLDRDAAWFARTFKPQSLNFEPLRATLESEAAGLRPPNPWAFARAVHRAGRAADAGGIGSVYASALVNRVRRVFCPVGRDVPIVCPDGSVHGCYLQERDWQAQGMDLRMGRADPDGTLSLDPASVEQLRRLTDLPESCRSCFCRWHCAGGCHVSMHRSRRKEGPDDFCVQTRILCACRLLDRLGRRDLADRMAEDRPAQEKLVCRQSDALRAWPAAGEM
jgi:uncharacterized protein